MKTNIKIHEQLFKDTRVRKLPEGFDLRFSFPSEKPKGAIHLRFVRGKIKEEDALIWETQVQVNEDGVPGDKDKIATWIEEAHKLNHNWFFKMIEGDLERRFQ